MGAITAPILWFTPTVCGENTATWMYGSLPLRATPTSVGITLILSLPEPGWDALMSEREPYLSRVKTMGVVGVMTIAVAGR